LFSLLAGLVLSGFAFIVATVGGIAAVNLTTYSKTGQMPGSAEVNSPV
jgi:hypothetical protein